MVIYSSSKNIAGKGNLSRKNETKKV